MKRIILLICVICSTLISLSAQSIPTLWESYEESLDDGKPQQAHQQLKKLISAALKQHDHITLVQATELSAHSQLELDDDAPASQQLARYNQALAADWLPDVDRAMLHFLKANFLLQIYPSYPAPKNREADMDESQIDEWTPIQYLASVSHHLAEVFDAPQRLAGASCSRYPLLLDLGEDSKLYKHDLAISLLQMLTEEGRYSPLYKLTIAVHPFYPIPAPTDLFQKPIAEKDNLPLRVLEWLHDIRQNSQDADRRLMASLVGATFSTLKMGKAGYAAALQTLLAPYMEDPSPSEVVMLGILSLAESYNRMYKRKEAHQLATTYGPRAPESTGGKRLKQLQLRIELADLSLFTQETQYSERPLQVVLKGTNVTSGELRIYSIPLSKEQVVKCRTSKPHLESTLRKQPLGNPLHTIPFTLPHSDNFEMVKDSITLPVLPPGFYALTIHAPRVLDNKGPHILYSTRILPLLRNQYDRVEVLALDGRSGRAIPQTEVTLVSEDDQILHTGYTDTEGKLSHFLPQDKKLLEVHVSHGEDYYSPSRLLWRDNDLPADEKYNPDLLLFSDRKLYQPGQKLFFKGICYQQDDKRGHVLADRKVSLFLIGENTRKQYPIGEFTSNEFGSFHGEFLIPKDMPKGEYLLTDMSGEGMSIAIEEYKRPTFEVAMERMPVRANLGEEFSLTGQAKYFAGMGVANAIVQYRLYIVPNSFLHFYDDEEILIEEGTTTTDIQGNISIKYPSLELPEGVIERWTQQMHRPLDRLLVKLHTSVEVIAPTGEALSTDHYAWVGPNGPSTSVNLSSLVLLEEQSPLSFKVLDGGGRSLSQHPGKYVVLPKEGDRKLLEGSFRTDTKIPSKILSSLKSGHYRMVMTTTYDGKEGCDTVPFQLYRKSDPLPPETTPLFIHWSRIDFDQHSSPSLLIGTSQKEQDVHLSIASANGTIREQTLRLKRGMKQLEVPLDPSLAPYSLSFIAVRDGKMYRNIQTSDVESNYYCPELRIHSFRDRLSPGETETWQIELIPGSEPQGETELAAWIFDASLDDIDMYSLPYWSLYRRQMYYSTWWDKIRNEVQLYLHDKEHQDYYSYTWGFDRLLGNPWGGYYGGFNRDRLMPIALTSQEDAVQIKASGAQEGAKTKNADLEAVTVTHPGRKITLRTNFSETALWRPILRLDAEQRCKITFTLPHSLTRYRVLLFAHDKGLHSADLDTSFVVNKPLMLTTNPPRFMREGDAASLAASLHNNTEVPQSGTARLALLDPKTQTVLHSEETPFTIAAKREGKLHFQLPYMAGLPAVICRLTAESGGHSDGEQRLIAQLPLRRPTMETLPLTLQKGATATIALDTLFNRRSATVTEPSLTVKLNANPAWAAIDALSTDFLSRTPTSSMELAGYLQSAALAKLLISQHAPLRNTLESRQALGNATQANPLTQNQELRLIATESSLYAGRADTYDRHLAEMCNLLDTARTHERYTQLWERLLSLQNGDGGFSWCPGMLSSLFISKSVATQLVSLRSLLPKDEALTKMLQQLGKYIVATKEKYYQSSIIKESFFSPEEAAYYITLLGEIDPQLLRGKEEHLAVAKHKLYSSPSKLRPDAIAYAILAEQKLGKKSMQRKLFARLLDYLVEDGHGGLYMPRVADLHGRAVSHTMRDHLYILKALASTKKHSAEIERIKIWLLNRKRLNDWGSPLTGSYALAGLMLVGDNPLSTPAHVSLEMGGERLETSVSQETTASAAPMAEKSWHYENVEEIPTTAVMHNEGKTVAWGAVYASFYERADHLAPFASAEIALKRHLYRYQTNAAGERTLVRLSTPINLNVGDEVVVELVIHAKDALDYMVINDLRPSALEPLDRHSGYTFSEGVHYFIEVGQTRQRLYLPHLPKGTTRITYRCRADRTGQYFGGMAEVQSAFATDYSAHSGNQGNINISSK